MTCWLHEMAWDAIEAHLATDDVVLVPIGATEQHGRHAPLLLDTGWAIAASEAAAVLAGCLVAPPLHYGWSYGHMAFPGTVGLTAATLATVATELGECLVRGGFRRVVYVNGNRMANLAPLEIAAVRLRLATGAFAAVADCGLVARQAVASLANGPPGTLGHAGESETALVLARYPHLVDMDRAPADCALDSVHPALRGTIRSTSALTAMLGSSPVIRMSSAAGLRRATASWAMHGTPRPSRARPWCRRSPAASRTASPRRVPGPWTSGRRQPGGEGHPIT